EAAGDAQLFGAGPQQLGRAALAEQQAERFEQERLAGPGLPGPGAEARPQLDADVLDEGQVLHEEFSQHRRRHLTGAGAAGEDAAAACPRRESHASATFHSAGRPTASLRRQLARAAAVAW